MNTTMCGATPLLRVRQLATRSGGRVDLDLLRGECVCILGRSGSGKSVLLRLLADLDPGEGRVALDGIDRNAMTGPQWRSRVVYQAAEPAWWDERVREHFPPAAHERLGELLAEAGLAPDLHDAEVARLSTGERQRLALLRSLVREPAVLLLDEPTGALDEATALHIEALLRRRLDAGLGIVMVTHSAGQAARMALRRFQMVDGQLHPLAEAGA